MTGLDTDTAEDAFSMTGLEPVPIGIPLSGFDIN
jgi:hypothetical protein